MDESKKIKKLFRRLEKSTEYAFRGKGSPVKVSKKQGVYIIYSPKGIILHVGATKRAKGGLDQRLNNHRTGTSSFRKKYPKREGIDLSQGFYFKMIEVPNDRERVLLEAMAISKLCPKHLGTGSTTS